MVLLDLDPNLVKPGWTPLLITIAIGLVLVLLFFSMRRQFTRIDVSRSQPGVLDPEAESADESVDPDSASVDRTS